MDDRTEPDQLRDELKAAWNRYVDLLTPHRPGLYAYCRRLSGNAWDAEDLVQEVLLRGFGHLGHLGQNVKNLRGYLLRTATHVYIDMRRRSQIEDRVMDERPPRPASLTDPEQYARVRDAGARLMEGLTPQERAAVVLKDVFELGIEEIAETIATTPGAVKAALHRARGRLRDEAPAPRRATVASKEIIDRFIERWAERDVPGLVQLLLEGGSAENVGFGLQYGSDTFSGTDHFLYKAVHGHEEWPESFQPESVRLARGEFESEPVVLCFATRRGTEALEQVLRIDEVDGRIARLRGYAFCPETMREIGAALGLEVRTGLYRVPDFDTPEASS
jgi:RNA polymerase sigma-70 factor (ECF subfamily)